MSNRVGKADYSERPIWLLCEGNDCYHFFMRVSEKLELTNIYCLDVKGVDDTDLFEGVAKRTNYNKAKAIIYVRDAEHSASRSEDNTDNAHITSITQSIMSRFHSIGLTVGSEQLELTDNGGKKAGYIILTDRSGNTGTLEDLCLDIAFDIDAVDDAESTINHINEKRKGKVRKHSHKRKLHIAFALGEKEQMIGARTGEAVTIGGLDLSHDRFTPIKEFLERTSEQY